MEISHRPALQTQIKRLAALMLRTHYFDEANWLWMASVSPHACCTAVARASLIRATETARELGYSDVANWLLREVLGSGSGSAGA